MTLDELAAAKRIGVFDPTAPAWQEWTDALTYDSQTVARAFLAAAREVERMREALREMVERWEPPEEDGQDRRMWEAARAALKETQT